MASRGDEDNSFVLDHSLTHQPVMLTEVLFGLNVQPEGIYIDGTFGRGGHSKAIVDLLGDAGQLYVMDKDPEAITVAQSQFAQDGRVKVVHASFAEIAERAGEYGILGKVAGVFLDLGVSSPQLDDARRGFSFRNEGPLDMRMNPQQGVSVATWLETASEAEIMHVLREYGEERYAKRIAQAILQLRAEVNITTTTQLAQLIAKSVP
ncbi:MAG: 16S rRNA (cytosine1402-N4)-methyltransferase, partial [Halothiobacillaceae bacterium]